MRLLESLGVELPVVQPGMAGGIARHELAVAVSDDGGLGTIGLADPPVLRRELAAARAATDRPLAVNLLLPSVRRAHAEIAADGDVVVTFWGEPRRRTPGVWLHQSGSVEEALAARAAGADGVIVQGVEAGGHLRRSRCTRAWRHTCTHGTRCSTRADPRTTARTPCSRPAPCTRVRPSPASTSCGRLAR